MRRRCTSAPVPPPGATGAQGTRGSETGRRPRIGFPQPFAKPPWFGVFAGVEPAGLQHPGDAPQDALVHETLQHDAMALRELLPQRGPPVVLDDARATGREPDHAASGQNPTTTESRAAAKRPHGGDRRSGRKADAGPGPDSLIMIGKRDGNERRAGRPGRRRGRARFAEPEESCRWPGRELTLSA